MAKLKATIVVCHSVKLRPGTLDRLARMRHRGQSWDGVVTELLDENEALKNERTGKDSPDQSGRSG